MLLLLLEYGTKGHNWTPAKVGRQREGSLCCNICGLVKVLVRSHQTGSYGRRAGEDYVKALRALSDLCTRRSLQREFKAGCIKLSE